MLIKLITRLNVSGLMDPIVPVISASRFSVNDDLGSLSDWVVLDATEHSDMGLPNKRLKERVLLAEYRYVSVHEGLCYRNIHYFQLVF